MNTYILKPNMTLSPVAKSSTPHKPALAPLRQPLPQAVLDPAKPLLKLGRDVHLEFTMAVARKGSSGIKSSRSAWVWKIRGWSHKRRAPRQANGYPPVMISVRPAQLHPQIPLA